MTLQLLNMETHNLFDGSTRLVVESLQQNSHEQRLNLLSYIGGLSIEQGLNNH